MNDKDANRNQICLIGSRICQDRPCNCKGSERAEHYQRLLNSLTEASKATDYEEKISATISAICAVCV
jgi:hypothetical protein